MTSHVYITINLFNLWQQSFLPFYIYFLKCCCIGWMNHKWPYKGNNSLKTPLPTKKSVWIISPSSLMNSTQVSTYCGSDGFVEDIWKSTRRHPLSDVPGRLSVFLFNFFCLFCNSFCFLSWNDNEYKTFELYFVSGL